MTYRPSRRRSRITSSARRSARPTSHCDGVDAGFDDGLDTRTSTITHHPVRGATKTTPNSTNNVTGLNIGPDLLLSFFGYMAAILKTCHTYNFYGAFACGGIDGKLGGLTPIGLYRENAIAIESEGRDPFGGNVYYVTMQITFPIPEFARKERNLHYDVVHVTTKWVSRLVLDHAIAAIQTSR